METRQQERGHIQTGLLERHPLQEEGEEEGSEVDLNNTLSALEREEIETELTKLEEEISTLKQVLASKEKQHAELKQQLGITPLTELRHNLTRGWNDMQTSSAYKKTSESLSSAGQKTSAAFSTLGTAISRKFGDMRSTSIGYSIKHSMSMPAMRNSPSFKSFEEKVENTVSNMKPSKAGGAGGAGSFEEVLSSTAQASALDTPTHTLDTPPHTLTDSGERTC